MPAKTYFEKLADPRWQRKKNSILERDAYICRDCGSTTETLHVHHCHYVRGNPWDTPAELLLTLCGTCHKCRQDLEDRARYALGIVFAGRQNSEDDEGLKALCEDMEFLSKEAGAYFSVWDEHVVQQLYQWVSAAKK